MGDEIATTNVQRLFRRETKGESVAPVTVCIERGRALFFAKVLGEKDPLYISIDAAREMGHPDIAVPPSFFMVIEALADEERIRRGTETATQLVGCDFRYLLHGDEHYSYTGLIYAGEEVSISTRVVDFYEKKGGVLEFVILESMITHAQRGLLIRAKRTLLHRLG